MDWLTFISSLVATLAWPATIIFVLYLFKGEFPKIIAALRRVKYKDFEAEFNDKVHTVAEEVKSSIPGSSDKSNLELSSIDDRSRLMTIAEVSPRAAILESWLLIEVAAVELLTKLGMDINTPDRRNNMMLELKSRNMLSSKQLYILNTLRYLRNKAAHIQDDYFTYDATKSYVDSALSIASYLKDKANSVQT